MARRRAGRVGEGEAEFLAVYDPAQFDRPSVAVDLVLMTVEERSLRVLVMQRAEHPSKGRWSLPGGFVGIEEALEDAAVRVLRGKARLPGVFVEQLYTFGAVSRDPRMRVISVAYFALVASERLRGALSERGDEAMALARVDVMWKGEEGGAARLVGAGGEELSPAFDHADMVGMAVKRLRGRVGYSPIGYELLPRRFTLRRLQDIHEAILGRELNKDSFRRKVLASGEVEATGERESEVGHRPAELYTFVKHEKGA